jgi:hypothetical protein
MRTLFVLWVSPLILFWGWYFLSLNDMNFGYVMLSRQLHDFVFQIYGEMLGVDPAIIPGMVAKACLFDSFLVLAIVAWRRRRPLAGWIRNFRQGPAAPTALRGAGPKLPAE